MKPSRAVIDAVNKEAAAKLDSFATNAKNNLTAVPEVSAVANARQISNLNNRFNLITRLTPNQSADGLIVGRVRSISQDQFIINSRIKIENEAAALVSKQKETKTIDNTFVSANQKIAATQNAGVVSQSKKDDLIRAYQKLQSKCNHIYDRSSQRCIYCKKHISSHVYDVGSKLLLKVSP